MNRLRRGAAAVVGSIAGIALLVSIFVLDGILLAIYETAGPLVWVAGLCLVWAAYEALEYARDRLRR